jgi:hypothetical protein
MIQVGKMAKTTALIVASLFLGLALGTMIMYGATRPVSQPASSTMILPPDHAKADPASYQADIYEGHHTIIDANAKIQGRVVLIGLYVENEQNRYHFLVLPDPTYSGMVNDNNRAKLSGALMVELLYNDNFVAPMLHIGMHVEVQGPHVTDNQNNNGWNEIDPASSIKEI